MQKQFNKTFDLDQVLLFLLLRQGQFVSQLRSQAFAIAMLFWTKHLTNLGSHDEIVLMLSILPQVIIDLLAKQVQIMLIACGFMILILSITILFTKNFLEFLDSSPTKPEEAKQENKISKEVMTVEKIT